MKTDKNLLPHCAKSSRLHLTQLNLGEATAGTTVDVLRSVCRRVQVITGLDRLLVAQNHSTGPVLVPSPLKPESQRDGPATVHIHVTFFCWHRSKPMPFVQISDMTFNH